MRRSTLAICSAAAQHRLEIVAEDLDRQILAHAGDQLVEAHLDRLREAELVARQFGGFGLDLLDQRRPWTWPGSGHSLCGLRMM